MSRAVKLSDDLVDQARVQGNVTCRSTAGQIEYWAKIGRIADENPDMTSDIIKDILLAREEIKAGQVEEYKFGEGS